MYRHIKNYEIKYSDVDAYDHLKMTQLLGFLQESACLSADELGFGYSVISKKNLGFILVNWFVELKRPINYGETIEVHTWPLKPKLSIFLRDFEIYINGEKVGAASSRWCIVDMQTFNLMRVADYFESGFFDGYNTERSIEFNVWKIPLIEEGECVYERTVRLCDYDHYFHVNNTRYADFLCDTFTVDDFSGKYIKNFQVTYVKQCKEGDVLSFTKKRIDDFYLIEGRVSDELRIQCKVRLDEI